MKKDRAPSDGGLRAIFRTHLPQIMWTLVETGLVSPGVPDSHGIGAAPPAFWVEYKRTDGWTIPLEVEQVGWLTAYVRRGGVAYVAVRRLTAGGPRSPAADDLFLLWGGQARALREGGLRVVVGPGASIPHALLGSWVGGPEEWDWGEVAEILSRARGGPGRSPGG